MKTLLVLFGVVALAVFAWWSSSTPTSLPVSGPVGGAAVAPGPVAGEHGATQNAQRQLAAEQHEAVWSGTRLPELSWRARFVVVDEWDRSVPSATVTVKGVVFGDVPPRACRPEPIATLRTDANGCAEIVTSEAELVVAAAIEPDRRSLEVRIFSGPEVPETRLVVERLQTLRGLVLREGGQPAVGARVIAYFASVQSPGRGHASPPDPVRTDAQGAFAFSVRGRNVYALRAELDGRTTLEERVSVGADERLQDEVVLVFRGVIVVRGIVLDARGEPFAGAKVSAWRESLESKRGDIERVDTPSEADGSFELSVRRRARYQLLAQAPGLASNEPVWIETSLERPIVETVLRLHGRTTIQGFVLGPDGLPVAGCKVLALAESAPVFARHEPSKEELFGPATLCVAGPAGGFDVDVHPHATYSLRFTDPARPDVWVQRDGIAPGSRGLEVRLGADELAGCRIRCAVTRDDGEPLGPVRVELWTYHGEVLRHSRRVEVELLDDGFVTPPLALGQCIALTVELRDESDVRTSVPLAPALVGPITLQGAECSAMCRLQRWAELAVRVVAADGRWAEGAVVSVWTRSPGLSSPLSPVRVDEQGRASFDRLLPGPVRVFAGDTDGRTCVHEVEVGPGPNPELVVRLSAVR